MNDLNTLINKIEQEVNAIIEQIKQEFEIKKTELKQTYNEILQQTKKQLDLKFKHDLELTKRRIYTENFIEYNKKVEQLKNELYKTLIDKLKQKLLNLEHTQYYVLLKTLLLKNVFHNETNHIMFDTSGKLNKTEQTKLLNEVETEIRKNYPQTKLLLTETQQDLNFGVKILAGEKSKNFTIDTLIEFIKPYAEAELNKILG